MIGNCGRVVQARHGILQVYIVQALVQETASRPCFPNVTTNASKRNTFMATIKSRSTTQHVLNAVARCDRVESVSNKERDAAWRRIRAAARKYGVEITERGWRQLFKNNGRRVPSH